MLTAAFLDLDKTTIDAANNMYEGLAEVLNPGTRDFKLTFITARGYPRLREAQDRNPALQVSPGAYIGLENGGRIVDAEHFENIYYFPLQPDELVTVFDHIRDSDDLKYVAFHPREPRSKTQLWSPDPQEAERLHQAYSHNADVFTGTHDELFTAIVAADPCMVTCKTYSTHEGAAPSGSNMLQNGDSINFITAGLDKGVATELIAGMMSLSLNEILAAGDEPRDLPMLCVEGLGQPVLVGNGFSTEGLVLPEGLIHIDNPNQLASVLSRVMGKS